MRFPLDGRAATLEGYFVGWDHRFFTGTRFCLVRRKKPEKLDARRHDLRSFALAAVVLDFELSCRDLPFNVSLPSLLQILMAGFRELPESDDMMPLDAFLLLALLVGERLIGCD